MAYRPTPSVVHGDAPLTPDLRALLAWRVELREAERNPWLASVLLRRLDALLSRAAETGARLAALPRRTRRGLAKCSALSLPLAAVALAVSGAPAHAFTIEVGVGGCGTIRDAIGAANAGGSVNGCAGSGAADTIVLGGGTYTYADAPSAYEADGRNALPSIASDITIQGNGAAIERDTSVGESFRLLHVAATGTLTLQDATVQGGEARGSGLAGGGGGILSRGTLELDASTVTGCSAQSGGGVWSDGTSTISRSALSSNQGTEGGGFLVGLDATASVTDSRISGNTAFVGGGVYVEGGATATLSGSTLDANSATFDGGGVHVANQGSLTITDSTLSRNQADGNGGGIRVSSSASARIRGSTLSDSSAARFGGGLFIATEGNATLSNSTLSGSSASESGGGIFVDSDGSVTLSNSTLSGSSAAIFGAAIYVQDNAGATLDNSIITNSLRSGDCFGANRFSGANNLVDFFEFGDCMDVSSAAVTAFDTTLADNGGPTLTHALLRGSNAIDAGADACQDSDGVALTSDQRGAPRPQDGDSSGSATCDIGAFEYAALFDLDVTLAGTGSGTVMGPAFLGGGIDCGEGAADCDETFANATTVGLTASPAEGSVFAGWGGDCDAAGEVVITADSACIATFDEAVPTAAVLASLEAEVAPIGRVTVRWSTASEAKVLGFLLYRQEFLGGRETRLTEYLLPARGSAATGADYAYAEHRLPGHYRYRLEAVLAGGERQALAPLRVQVAPGRVGLR